MHADVPTHLFMYHCRSRARLMHACDRLPDRVGTSVCLSTILPLLSSTVCLPSLPLLVLLIHPSDRTLCTLVIVSASASPSHTLPPASPLSAQDNCQPLSPVACLSPCTRFLSLLPYLPVPLLSWSSYLSFDCCCLGYTQQISGQRQACMLQCFHVC